jgi:CheY-like chemotaxis protein
MKERILVVDDDELMLKSVQEMLDKFGYQCDSATSVEDAAEMLMSNSYQLLISDINMPGNTDLEFIKRRHEFGGDIPVILITGFPEIKSAVESIQLGVVAYLLKPFSPDELRAKTQLALQGFRVRQVIGSQKERLQDWLKELSEIDSVSEGGGHRLFLPVQNCLDLTLNHIIHLSADLKRLAEAATHGNGQAEACHLIHCPKLELFRQALIETIETLEQSKSSFRSKELGTLRKRLQEILKNWDQR